MQVYTCFKEVFMQSPVSKAPAVVEAIFWKRRGNNEEVTGRGKELEKEEKATAEKKKGSI